MYGHVAVVEALLAAGAAVDLQNKRGAFGGLWGCLSLFGVGGCFVRAPLRAYTRRAHCFNACIDAHTIYALLLFIRWFGC